MAFIGRTVDKLRNWFGFDYRLDETEQRINSIGKKEEHELKRKDLQLQTDIDTLSYELLQSNRVNEAILRITQNIKNIEMFAKEDINKVDSGMEGAIDTYTGNLFELNNLIDILRKSLGAELYTQYKSKLYVLEQDIMRRYINVVLQRGVEDNGDLARNVDITTLFQSIQNDVQNIPNIHSDFTYYDWLMDIDNQITEISLAMNASISYKTAVQNNLKNSQGDVQHLLNTIQFERDMLKHSKEYLEQSKDKEAARGR